MNETLAAYMKLAMTAIVISALLWNKLMGVMGSIADKIATIIS
jgi:hypothetical protein